MEEKELDRLPEVSEPTCPLEALYAKIAEQVRENSKNLSKLTSLDSLNTLLPEEGSEEPIDLTAMLAKDEYQDIKSVGVASGAIYLYSNLYITDSQAIEKGMAEEMYAKIADKVREDSRDQIKLTPVDALKTLIPEFDPESSVLADMAKDERYQDIQSITGPTGLVYLFSETHITRNYANILALAEANDPCVTIATTVREESRIYPRPTNIELFKEPVFRINPDEIQTHVARLLERPEFQDIRKLVAPTGAIYLYSDRYLNEALAQAMVRYLEVERFEYQ